jgi:predicted XRE-type DNA-binding protein
MKRKGKKHVQAIKADIASLIAARIDHLKVSTGTSQSALAEKIGLTQPRLSALRSGKLDQFSLDALVQIAVDLGLSVQLRVTRPYRLQ